MSAILGGVLGAFPALTSATALTRYFETLDVQDSTADVSLTYNVPANTLDTNEDSLLVIASWTMSAVNDTPRLTFGGTAVFTGDNLAGNVEAMGIFLITRLGSNSQSCVGLLVATSNVTEAEARSTAAIDLVGGTQAVVADFTTANAARRVNRLFVAKLRRA